MRAIILAGGKGTRLRPYTVSLPKPLVPVGEYPILEIVVRQLIKHNFTHITLAVNHLADVIMAFFGNGSRWGVKIDYSVEDEMLSTMGPLKLIKDLPEHFLVMNGDVLTDLNFNDFFYSHVRDGSNIFTVATSCRKVKSEYGVIKAGADGKIIEFHEKPEIEYNVSMGVYMASREVLKYIPDNVPYGFDQLMNDLIEKKRNAVVIPYRGYWLDIGRPDDYQQAVEEFDSMKRIFL